MFSDSKPQWNLFKNLKIYLKYKKLTEFYKISYRSKYRPITYEKSILQGHFGSIKQTGIRIM